MRSARFNSTSIDFQNFNKLKMGDLISWGGGPILQNGWIIRSPLLYFNFTSLKGPTPPSFIRFQCIVLDSAALFTTFEKFFKLNRGDLISGGNQFCRSTELFGSPYCILIWKIWRTQDLLHSLDFNALYLTQQHFSQILKISSN